MFALSVPPFFQVERGFYKSSAAVYLSAAIVTAAGVAMLAIRGPRPDGPDPAVLWTAAALWILFCAVLGVYLSTLWTASGWLRARSYALGLATGLVALLFSALMLEPGGFGFVGAVAFALTAITSSLVLGFASGAMLFGHWYLIDPHLPVDYLRNFIRMLAIALIVDLAALAIAVGMLAVAGGAAGASAVRGLIDSDALLLAARMAIGPGATIMLTWMTWQTLKVPQTMAATGLLYIAVMSALVGEMLGRFIMFRTSVPL